VTDGGRILLTSSVSARLPVAQHTLYAASKAAVSAMALNLAPEVAERGIAINAIAARGTATDMAADVVTGYTPPALRDVPADAVIASLNAIGRLAQPAEIAAVPCSYCPQTPPTSQARPSRPPEDESSTSISHVAPLTISLM
jgi:3-oxoacyl-[acyl-carrier protein] reductase